VSVSVCPILITGVTASRSKTGVVTVAFTVKNTDGTKVISITLNSATLGGVATSTAMPISISKLLPGASKSVSLKFNNVPSGSAQFIVNGTSSAGPVCTNTTVNVP